MFDKRGSLSYNDGLHSCCFREIKGNTIIKMKEFRNVSLILTCILLLLLF